MAPFPIELDGTSPGRSVEHYYQAQKFFDPALQEKIRTARKPVIAKSLAAEVSAQALALIGTKPRMRSWSGPLRAKFAQYEVLRALLLATGAMRPLAEAAPNDYYWGVGEDGTGQNKLGVLLMRIRMELRAAE